MASPQAPPKERETRFLNIGLIGDLNNQMKSGKSSNPKILQILIQRPYLNKFFQLTISEMILSS
jgi:hypothetical protein